MISGLVATLRTSQNNSCQEDWKEVVDRLSAHPAIEVGELCNGNRLPLTIETGEGWPSEELTRWISDQPGVEFVDVVCVHYETQE